MNWDEALTYDSLVQSVAEEWAMRVNDPSLKEDIAHHLYIRLVKKVKTDNAENVQNYVRAALWKQAEKYMRSYRNRPWSFESLEDLSRRGVQIDTTGRVYLPDGWDIG